MTTPRTPHRLPTREELLEFIQSAPGKITKRDIARAFAIKGPARVQLKALLKDLLTEGAIAKEAGKNLKGRDSLPAVLVIEVTGVDTLGDLVARPVGLKHLGEPRIFIAYQRRRKGLALKQGDRALARLIRQEDEHGAYYAARIIRPLKGVAPSFIGVFHKTVEGGEIIPADRKTRLVFSVSNAHINGAIDNALVLAESLGRSQRRKTRHYKPEARIIENLGDLSQPKSVSLIAIHHHDIPYRFAEEVLAEATKAQPAGLEGRSDLRALPFLTIDPEDARDHDDAIVAHADSDPRNRDGWKLSIAIADVAHYVTPNSALDREARVRGNSCYFPDRVVPMLPDALSGNLCSLLAGQDRAVLVCHIIIDASGRKRSHHFERALIRCEANVTYQEAQRAINGEDGPLADTVRTLHQAYLALKRARDARGPLELELPERKVILNQDGTVQDIQIRQTLASHKLIEEYMVAANVAAAETLVNTRTLCMFRVHEPPSRDKLESLRDFLETLSLKFARGSVVSPQLFNSLLLQAAGSPLKASVNDMVLRTQAQAVYSPDNLGHFGLALTKYAHFTSPIRRYADVLVHRALITALRLGKDGLVETDLSSFRKIGEQISATERRAMAAERESTDRYLALFLSERIGEAFRGRITGVTRFGLFASVEPSGADGFIPMASLQSDYYAYDEKRFCLVGRNTHKKYRLGDVVQLRLLESDPVTGGLRFDIAGEQGPASKPMKRQDFSRRQARSKRHRR